MIYLAKIKKMKDKLVAFIEMLGTEKPFKINIIYPFGLYGKPKDKKGLRIEDFLLHVSEYEEIPLNLKDNDLILTDYKSYIYFDNKNKIITIKADKIEFKASEIILNADNIEMDANDIKLNSISLTHNGINIGATHKHIDSSGKTTSPPF